MPFLVTLCVAAAPLTALVVLALLGLVGLLPAAAAIGFTILGSAVFSLVWARDVDALTVGRQRAVDRRHPDHLHVERRALAGAAKDPRIAPVDGHRGAVLRHLVAFDPERDHQT